MANPELTQAAAGLLAREHTGVLSTISVKLNGMPFGSVVDFAIDAEGRPVLLISGLAQHTKNLLADPRASLTVRDHTASNAVEGARLTIAGTMRHIENEEGAPIWSARFPDTGWAGFGDFSYWRLEPAQTYVVAGFGAMGWV